MVFTNVYSNLIAGFSASEQVYIFVQLIQILNLDLWYNV